MPLQLVYDLTQHNTPSDLNVTVGCRIPSGTVTIDWGDGSPTENFPNNSSGTPEYLSHVYTSAVTRTVTVDFVSGLSTRFDVGGGSLPEDGRECVTSCTQFPANNLENIKFRDCVNLVSVPTSIPADMTNLQTMFLGCTSFQQDLNSWDMSLVEDIRNMFAESNYNQPLNTWDTSNIYNFGAVFRNNTSFNQDLSTWNVSEGREFSGMFSGATSFNGNIDNWTFRTTGDKVTFIQMFSNATSFTRDISGWNTEWVYSLSQTFYGATNFNTNISSWNTSSVVTLYETFHNAKSFNQPIGGWNTSLVTNMKGTFHWADNFNQPLGWDTSSVTTMEDMFRNAQVFNQDITAWDVSLVETFDHMFQRAFLFDQNINLWTINTSSDVTMVGMFADTDDFNQDLNSWNTSRVIDMKSMFYDARSFNGNITGWNTSNVQEMEFMFSDSPFNRDIGGWDISSCNDLRAMFQRTDDFNQDLSSWDTSNVTDMSYMFFNALSFDQDVSDWDVSSVTTMTNMFTGAFTIQLPYYENMLTKWATQPVKTNVRLDAGANTQYTCGSLAESARDDDLIGTNNWTINDGGCLSNESTYFVDISIDGVFGDGTEGNPFSYEAFLANTPTITNGEIVTYKVKGYRKLDGSLNFNKFVADIGSSIPSTSITFSMEGWNIEENGSPIVEWVGDESGGKGGPGLFDAIYLNTSISVRDFIFINNNGLYLLEIDLGSLGNTYRDVLFNSRKSIVYTSGSDRPMTFYGCTFQMPEIQFSGITTYTSIDCVYLFNDGLPDNSYIGNPFINNNGDVVVFANNITNIPRSDFTDIIYATDISDYNEPVYDSSIQPVPLHTNSTTALVATYTSPNAMYFANYNVPVSDSPIVQDSRVNNDYDNGLFGHDRESYGAYSFLLEAVDPGTFPTSGHIGAFYFGGDYDNVDAHVSVGITLEPTEDAVSVSTDASVDEAFITLHIPDEKLGGFAIGNQNFFVDFVGKERGEEEYPNFCRCDTNNCDREEYEEQVTGANPLVVDFSACARAAFEYEGYNPVEYKWWFDYENNPDDYVTCAGPYATHTYCGRYLEDYDVRLCVEFEYPITSL